MQDGKVEILTKELEDYKARDRNHCGSHYPQRKVGEDEEEEKKGGESQEESESDNSVPYKLRCYELPDISTIKYDGSI